MNPTPTKAGACFHPRKPGSKESLLKIVTAEEMRQIDKKATERYGIPAIILMENAAISSAFVVLKVLKVGQGNVVLFCGQGNNGGDGFACARHLINHAVKVKVYFPGRERKLSKEAKINYGILRRMGQKILRPKLPSLKKELNNTDLIIDALLGIGLKDKVREPVYSLIELINGSKKPVLSLDIPSGLDATSGKVHGIAVKAKHTVTFGLFKRGFLNPQALTYTGRVTVGDISLPRRLLY
ncbi:MAG: NAD(P)H-hydrate epimerase [Candidatus Omnitrophica bacterium]|nr:NAD(P)H-hydrate epimerase [Candidatus Omnitrophota bacterium]MBU3934219.1 NAD(P)H-hydrate epimerase [Candidatus Omnitrophota bacterium]MBU4141153.1 NAD(P)H-hydrate epimerase [Candidatus Omnitrophota bacterium]